MNKLALRTSETSSSVKNGTFHFYLEVSISYFQVRFSTGMPPEDPPSPDARSKLAASKHQQYMKAAVISVNIDCHSVLSFCG